MAQDKQGAPASGTQPVPEPWPPALSPACQALQEGNHVQARTLAKAVQADSKLAQEDRNAAGKFLKSLAPDPRVVVSGLAALAVLGLLALRYLL